MRRLAWTLPPIVAAALLPAAPAAADSGVSYVRSEAVFSRLDPAHPVKIRVTARAAAGIDRVEAKLRRQSETEPYATVTGFTLVSGDSRDGVWEATYSVDIDAHTGINYVQTVASSGDASGTFTTGFTACYQATYADLTMTPETVDTDHRDVTVRGRLLIQKSRDSAPEPARGTELSDGFDPPSAVTAADGTFAMPTKAKPHVVIASRSSLVAACRVGQWLTPKITVQNSELNEVRLVGAAQPVKVGTEVTVEGRATRQAPSGWVPAGGAHVTVSLDSGEGASELTSGEADADGTDGTVSLPAFALLAHGTR